MASATVQQRLFLIDVARRGYERQREWVQSRGKGPSSPSGVREIIEVAFQRYVSVPLSQTEIKNECLEARWIEPWREGPAKYALTPLGFVQIENGA